MLCSPTTGFVDKKVLWCSFMYIVICTVLEQTYVTVNEFLQRDIM